MEPGLLHLLTLAGIFLGGVGVSVATRRAPPALGLGVWALVSAALAPIIVQVGIAQKWAWFVWAKTPSVIGGVLWFQIGRIFGDRIPRNVVGLGVYAILLLNIGEAIAMDAKGGRYLNVAAGVILLATMPLWTKVRVQLDGLRELTWGTAPSWVFAYALWQSTYIFGEYGSWVFSQHVVLNAVAVILAWREGWDRWFALRAWSLGAFLLVYDVYNVWFRANFPLQEHPDPTVTVGLGAASLALVGFEAFRWWKRRMSG